MKYIKSKDEIIEIFTPALQTGTENCCFDCYKECKMNYSTSAAR